MECAQLLRLARGPKADAQEFNAISYKVITIPEPGKSKESFIRQGLKA